MLALFWLGLSDAQASVRMAVMEFTNAADDDAYDALGKGLQSMLTTDLSGVQSVTLVEREKLASIQDELDLGTSKWVDPGTATKVGKLAGASHLVGGSFTVVGKQMRLDARIFEVESGKILAAKEQSGDRDAFFELEKDLVDELIKALEIELSPKERANVRRLHTADFEAFEDFSNGLNHFDEQRYDEALAALSEAIAVDEDFKLARLTLEAYEELIAKMRTRADALDAQRAARERLEDLKSNREEDQIVAGLIEKVSKGDERARLAALHALVLMYERRMRHIDRFARARARDAYMAQYFAEAEARWPQLPLLPRDTSSWGASSLKADTFEADFQAYARMVWEGVPGEPDAYWKTTRPNYVKRNLSDSLFVNYIAQWLHLDQRSQAKLYERTWDLLAKAGDPMELSEAGDRKRWLRHAERLRQLSQFDASTALLKRLADAESDARTVRDYADEIEENAQLKAISKGLDALRAEVIFLGIADRRSVAYLKQELDGWDDEGLKWLTRRRRLDSSSVNTNNAYPTYVSGHPSWTMQREKSLFTGARAEDPRRGEGLRYYRQHREGRDPGPDSMLLLDGVPRDQIRVAFTLSATKPADFVDPDTGLPFHDQPAVVDVLLGWKDIDSPRVEDDQTREVLEQPMPHGLAVRIHPDRVELVRRHGEGDSPRTVKTWKEEVLESAPIKGGKKGMSVEVVQNGASVTVTVNGSKQRWKAEGLERGFYGFGFRGAGLAVVDELAIGRP